DWRTFSSGDMQIGNNTVSITEGMQNFNTTVILNFETTSAYVKINCNFDTSTGIAKWLLQGRDPYNTSELADFLPPNKENIAPQGEGWISYSVKQRPNLPTGTVIKNKARIDFEVDIPPEPMDTPEFINTIDSGVPTSKVNTLSASQSFDSFNVSWSGSDDTGGSGIRDYTIYVSDNNGEYESWLTNTKATSGIFKGKANHTYKFYSIAADNVGNIEPKPSEPDAVTSIKEATVTNQGKKGGKKGICFITAITNNKHSDILTEFRDNYLFTNYLGRTFTNLYYKISPFITNLRMGVLFNDF
ncbi:hypothetical protein HY745_07075, partial [Candidatus Desantisbacteria bacterium]|nr:hypothetical protein [Candidatus Desantisbacteria bacterium]